MMADLVFEAMCQVCGIDWKGAITPDQRGRVNQAIKQLRSVYRDEEAVLPMMIHERAAAWKVVYPNIPLTPQSLTGHWSSILPAAEQVRQRQQETKAQQRRETNAHVKRGCPTCGDDHFVSVGYDSSGNELTAPCPDCNTNSDATYWVDRRKIEPMDPAKTREMMEFDKDASAARAEAGMEQARQAERVQLWKSAAENWMISLPPGTVFHADDMAAVIGVPDAGPNRNNVIGGIFSAAATRGLIRWTGETRKSERVDRHVGLQRVWVKL
jgi:predicted  nucleic acid-binding Zn-ribbon protein